MPTISFEIDHPNSDAGWMRCAFTIDGVRHPLDATAVFPPFLDLLYIIKDLATQRLPRTYFWEEEGFGVDFRFSPVPNAKNLVHLRIARGNLDPWLDSDIEADALIQAFLPPLLDLSENCQAAEREWNFPQQFVNNIYTALQTGDFSQKVQLFLRSDYDNYQDGSHTLLLLSNYEHYLSCSLHDTDLFWEQWFGFLERIATADFPAQCDYEKETEWSILDLKPRTHRQEVRFQAIVVDDKQKFRFKVSRMNGGQEAQLLIDETLDRQNFVQEFLAYFDELLQNTYQMLPDQDGKTFDLRSLPLDKIRDWIKAGAY